MRLQGLGHKLERGKQAWGTVSKKRMFATLFQGVIEAKRNV